MAVKPTRRELLTSWRRIPCPDRGCAGEMLVPSPPRTEPVDCTCDGMWRHTYAVSLAVPSTPTKKKARP